MEDSKISVSAVNFWYKTSKNITKLSLSNYNVNQEVLNNLGEYLQTEDCCVTELVFDGIDLSNKNYLCCLTSNTKINKLWLRCCHLKDRGIDNLLAVLDETNGKTSLHLLYLDCNGITCEGAKQIAKVLRTNRTLEFLSLARNAIRDEGALALVNVLSKFQLNDDEIKWKIMREQRRTKLVEYLMDVILVKENQRQNVSNDSTSNMMPSTESTKNNNMDVITENNLRQKAESMIVSNSHPYLTGQLLKTGLNFHCPGNFKIERLNLSYNRFSSNVLNVVEQILQYQQKICLPKEGIRSLRIEGFETTQKGNIYRLVKEKLCTK